MSPHVARCLDPTRAQLRAVLDAACRAAAPGGPAPTWEPALAAAGHRRGGVFARRSPDGRGVAVVCWWTDVLGRRHWLIDPDTPDGPSDLGPGGCRLLDDRHPLEWLAPPLSSGWRSRGGRREFVVLCRCGCGGPAASLAWTGAVCGPCSDRDQDGLPPAAGFARVGEGIRAFVGDAGPLVVAAADGRVTAHEPWHGPPAWRWDGHGPGAVAVRGPLVAVASEGGEVTLIDAASGAVTRAFHAGRGLRAMALAGPTLVTMHADRLHFWDVRSAAPTHQVTTRRAGRSLVADRGGHRVAAVTEGGVEVREVSTGRLLERLAVSAVHGVGHAAWAADGSLFVSWAVADRGLRLCRWGPAPAAAPGLLTRLLHGARRPDAAADAECGPVALTPCGRFVLTAGGVRLTLHDRQTLRPVAAFSPSGGPALHDVAFAAGGRLVACTNHGLAVWPWREVFGV